MIDQYVKKIVPSTLQSMTVQGLWHLKQKDEHQYILVDYTFLRSQGSTQNRIMAAGAARNIDVPTPLHPTRGRVGSMVFAGTECSLVGVSRGQNIWIGLGLNGGTRGWMD